jgi:hypothetical protein
MLLNGGEISSQKATVSNKERAVAHGRDGGNSKSSVLR